MGYFSNLDIEIEDTIRLYEKRPKWELLNIKKALELFGGILNTDEENIRLQAVKTILKRKQGGKK